MSDAARVYGRNMAKRVFPFFLGLCWQEELPARAPLLFHLASNQAVLKLMAATESGGSWILAFPSLILTVCKGWLQMAFGFS